MRCWADGGWDHRRELGIASVLIEGRSKPTTVPIFNPLSSSGVCEAHALVLALSLTPNSPDVEILMDSLTVVDMVSGKTRCTVLELLPYIRWAQRMLGERRLRWIPRDQNRAHVSIADLFADNEHWHDYELTMLRERKYG